MRIKKNERIIKSVGILYDWHDHKLLCDTGQKSLDYSDEWSYSETVWNGTMNQDNNEPEKDPVEEVVKHIHIILPIVGAVLIFMLAAIAITMA